MDGLYFFVFDLLCCALRTDVSPGPRTQICPENAETS